MHQKLVFKSRIYKIAREKKTREIFQGIGWANIFI